MVGQQISVDSRDNVTVDEERRELVVSIELNAHERRLTVGEEADSVRVGREKRGVESEQLVTLQLENVAFVLAERTNGEAVKVSASKVTVDMIRVPDETVTSGFPNSNESGETGKTFWKVKVPELTRKKGEIEGVKSANWSVRL